MWDQSLDLPVYKIETDIAQNSKYRTEPEAKNKIREIVSEIG